MNLYLPILLVVLVLLNGVIVLWRTRKSDTGNPWEGVLESFRFMKEQNERLEKGMHDEFQRSRSEQSSLSKDNREEMAQIIRLGLERIEGSMHKFGEDMSAQAKQSQERISEIRNSVDNQLKTLREDNTRQLEEMRRTVDEKLQKTLNERLAQSFETVGKQLLAVENGLGEMKALATDVGGLKKVLSNVKLRGGMGEIQLSMLLDQILAPDQYAPNVKTKAGSADLVEFAIKLPGKDEDQSVVWLPIDAKFPRDVYEAVQDAYDDGDPAKIQGAQAKLDSTIKAMAKDIHDKYIDPPHTTDFAIMFLPFEGIYAEVVRKAALLEHLQRTYQVIVTGPTTLGAILNSLQMGFKTLAIQKRSSEVWQTLGAVKTEFSKFGDVMQKAQRNIQSGLDQLEDVIGKRSKAIQRKLREVEQLSVSEADKLLVQKGEEEE